MILTNQDQQTEKQTVWNDRTGKTEDVDPGTDPNALATPDSGSSKAFTDIILKPDAQLRILKNLEQVYSDSPFGLSFRQRAEEDHSFEPPKRLDLNAAAQEGVATGALNIAAVVPAVNIVERGKKLQDSYTSLLESVSEPKGIWDIAKKGLQRMFFESPEEASKRVEARMGATPINIGGTVMPASSWVQKTGFDLLTFTNEKIKSWGLDKQYKFGAERFTNELAQNATSLAYALGVSYLTKNEHIAAASFGLIQKAATYKEMTQTANVKDMKTGKVIQVPYKEFKEKFQQDVEGKYAKDQMSIDGSMMMVRPPMDTSSASTLSTIGAIPEAAFEYVGLQMIMKGLRGVKPLLRTTMITLEQGIQEGLQQGSEELLSKIGWDRPGTKTDIAKRISYAALMGMILGVPAGGMSSFAMTQDFKGQLMNEKNLTEEEADQFMEKVYGPSVRRVYEMGGEEAKNFVYGLLKENGLQIAEKKKTEKPVTEENVSMDSLLEEGTVSGEIAKEGILKQWEKLKKLIPEKYHAVIADMVDNDFRGFTALVQKLIVVTKDAKKTTAPHEAFHVIYNELMKEEDKDPLIAEVNAVTGLQDPLEIEEYLAERFGEYWVGVEEKTKNIGGLVSQFVQDSTQFLKDFALGENPFTSSIAKAFDKIRRNAFTEGVKAKEHQEKVKMQMKKVLESEEFKKWFKDSKVVDEEGNPLVVYHGTAAEENFSIFDTNRETGSHFGTSKQANSNLKGRRKRLGEKEENARVIPAFLSIKNPLKMKDIGSFHAPLDVISELHKMGMRDELPLKKVVKAYDEAWSQYEKSKNLYDPKIRDIVREAVTGLGYDGIEYENKYESSDGSKSFIAFDPTQIKSATGNLGTFDPESPDIRFQLKKVSDDPSRVVMNGEIVSVKDILGPVRFQTNIATLHGNLQLDPGTELIKKSGLFSEKEINKPIESGEVPKAIIDFGLKPNKEGVPGWELVGKGDKARWVSTEKGYEGKSESWIHADKLSKKMLNGEIKLVESGGDLYFVATGEDAENIMAYKYSTPFKEENIKVKAYILDMPAVYTCRNAAKCAASCYAVGAQVQYPASKLGRFANLYMWMNHRAEFAKRIQAQLDNDDYSLVRIHSSGDIFSQTYLDFLTDLAENNTDKMFYVYTKADPGELDFEKLDSLPNFNRVRSLLPDGSINYGNQEYLEKKSKEFKIPICPASKQVHDIQEKIKAAKGNTEEIERLRAEYKDESKAIHCANPDYTGKGKKCNLCTKNKNMLFLEHGTPQLSAAGKMLEDVRDPNYWEGIRYQKKKDSIFQYLDNKWSEALTPFMTPNEIRAELTYAGFSSVDFEEQGLNEFLKKYEGIDDSRLQKQIRLSEDIKKNSEKLQSAKEEAEKLDKLLFPEDEALSVIKLKNKDGWNLFRIRPSGLLDHYKVEMFRRNPISGETEYTGFDTTIENIDVGKYGKEFNRLMKLEKDIAKYEYSNPQRFDRRKDRLEMGGTADKQGMKQFYSLDLLKFLRNKSEDIRFQKKQRSKDATGKLIPPVGRGGLQSPQIDFSKIKDKAIGLQYSTETGVRNLEDIIKDDATLQSLKTFLTDAVRNNETNRASEATAMRLYVAMEMKRLGIKTRSEESKLVQQFGEKKITLQQLQQASPGKWAEIQEASKIFRDLYDDFINRWNAVLQRFDYDPITPLPDYFRHFQLIGNIIEHIGMLGKMDKIPAEIYGLSQYFQPGKPFSTAQLKREGFQTTEDAISGFDNYIDSVTRVIHHTDSVQRARVLEKYVGQAIEEKEANLPKLRMWLKEYGNLLAGKQSNWDRVPEAEIGRTILSAFTFLKTQVAKNMFLGNVSSALIQVAPFTQALADTQKMAFARGMLDAVRSPFLTSEFNLDGQRSEFYVRRYPENKIDYTAWERAEKAAADIFQIADQFAAKTIIAGYYHEGISKGMTPAEAMKSADDQASRVMADRSWGALPNIFKSKVLGFFTQFQIEVNNSFRNMLKDVPRKKDNDAQVIWTIVQWLVLSTLFNDGFDKLLGRRPLFDPIEFLITMLGWNDSGQKKSIGVKLRQAGGELIQNLPFAGVASGRFPVMAFIPDVPGALEGKKKWGNELMKPVYYLAAPFAGGQLKKTIEGVSAYAKGKVTTPKRKDVKYRIKKNAANFVRAVLFGKHSFPEAVKYYNAVGRKKSSKSVL